MREGVSLQLAMLREWTNTCRVCARRPHPVLMVMVEVRDRESKGVLGQACYCRGCYTGQGASLDRDNRIVIVYRGWEFMA